MRKESTTNQGLDENLICRSLDACLCKRGMTFFVYYLLSGVAHAECVPTPDCASIGYTETSCDGGFVRCPFDTSKLFCIPCDSSYKYTCSGENITGGVGSACGGKYVSCSCSNGGIFNNGACPQNCTVGMIYYSDKSCSSTYDNSKTAIGIVVKDNELVMNLSSRSPMPWSNAYLNTSLEDLSYEQAKNDFNGRTNTATIIAEDSDNVAAVYCNDYRTSGTNAGDWYLPAFGELYSYVYGNYNAINTAMTSLGWTWYNEYHWSSSECSYDYIWVAKLTDGDAQLTGFKDRSGTCVACFLEIN